MQHVQYYLMNLGIMPTNGDKKEIYVDVYQKAKNVRIKCELGK